jgi:P4 family phage/plasmid primase-like protien
MDSMNKPETKLSIQTARKQTAICQILTGALKLDETFESKILNKSTYELPIKDGNIINLETLKIRKRTRTDYFSFELEVDFKGDEYNKTEVNKFMASISGDDIELMNYHKQLWGYMMTGDITDRAFYIFYGGGCNGKSSIVNIFKGIMNNFVAQLSEDAIIKKKSSGGATPELMPLLTARCALLPESDKGDILNVSRIKTITGDDSIKARNLFSNQIEFKTQAKLILPTNFKPDIKNVEDKALFDRLRLIPFNATFEKSKTNNEYIKNLQTNHLSDFFTYFVYGAYEWCKTKDLKPCSVMIKAVEDYKQDNDIYLKFVHENYITKSIDEYNILPKTDKPKWRILKSQVFNNFNMWLKLKNDNDNRKVGKKEFFLSMKEKMTEIKVSSEYYICKEIETIEQENQTFDNALPAKIEKLT